jgi:hypothetical protein
MTIGAAAGPREADEGIFETHQRVIKVIEDESKNLLQVQV